MEYDFAYPPSPEFLVDFARVAGRYEVRFAQNIEDLDKVLKLRFEVFNLEMNEGLDSSHATQRDLDPFDPHCHHLMINLAETGECIGTYRMQTNEMAERGIGYYTDGEYHLSDDLPPEFLSNSLELGRACISREYRNGKVLFLLWQGLIKYLIGNKKQYYFGCCSLTSQDPEEGLAVYEYLKENSHLWEGVDIRPRPGFECVIAPDMIRTFPEVHIPQLMRIYLNYGVKVASGPAIDREFKTIDYFALADVDLLKGKIFENM